MSETLKRIDPRGCRCADCLTGYSKPVNLLTEHEKDRIAEDDAYIDATGLNERQWNRILERVYT